MAMQVFEEYFIGFVVKTTETPLLNSFRSEGYEVTSFCKEDRVAISIQSVLLGPFLLGMKL